MLSCPRDGALAAGWLGALLSGAEPADTALSHLADLNPSDWLGMIAAGRSAGADRVRLFLPRPGDPRGLPTEIASMGADAVIGWADEGSIYAWTVVRQDAPWVVAVGHSTVMPPIDLAEADRQLRGAILRGAQALDELDQQVDAQDRRRSIEMELRVWTQAPLPPARAALAARAVPLLLAVTNVPEAGWTAQQQRARRDIVRELDPAVRAAVEVAYSST